MHTQRVHTSRLSKCFLYDYICTESNQIILLRGKKTETIKQDLYRSRKYNDSFSTTFANFNDVYKRGKLNYFNQMHYMAIKKIRWLLLFLPRLQLHNCSHEVWKQHYEAEKLAALLGYHLPRFLDRHRWYAQVFRNYRPSTIRIKCNAHAKQFTAHFRGRNNEF